MCDDLLPMQVQVIYLAAKNSTTLLCSTSSSRREIIQLPHASNATSSCVKSFTLTASRPPNIVHAIRDHQIWLLLLRWPCVRLTDKRRNCWFSACVAQLLLRLVYAAHRREAWPRGTFREHDTSYLLQARDRGRYVNANMSRH